MKKMIFTLALALSSAAMAGNGEHISPRFYNSGHLVQVEIHNTTKESITCWGPVYIDLESGRMDIVQFQETIPAGAQKYRKLYPTRYPESRVISFRSYVSCR